LWPSAIQLIEGAAAMKGKSILIRVGTVVKKQDYVFTEFPKR
jgi:hypothetical protein